MNILVVDDDWPTEYSGKAIRILNTFKRLQSKHELHFLYLGNTPKKNTDLLENIFKSINLISLDDSSFNSLGRILNLLLLKPGSYAKWKYLKTYQNAIRKIKNVLQKNNIEAVHTYSFFTAQYLKNFNNVIKIWDVGDSYYLNCKRNLKFCNVFAFFKNLLYSLRLYNYEQEMIKAFNKTIFVSSKDASIHNNLKKNISVITNGVDLEYYKPILIEEDYPSLVFTGHMNFEPNIRAMVNFIDNCFKTLKKAIPHLKLYIVGAEPTDEVIKLSQISGVTVTGKVNDVRPFLAKSSIFIAPMISGSGVKNKVLQAMAMGKAVISTPLGIEALSEINNEELIVADNYPNLCNRIILLLNNNQLRISLGVRARQAIEERYSWDIAINNYERLYQTLYGYKFCDFYRVGDNTKTILNKRNE